MDRAGWAVAVKNVVGWDAAAPHLGLDLSQSWRIASISTLQNNRAKAKVLSTHLRQLSSIQRSTNATPHDIAHTRRANVP